MIPENPSSSLYIQPSREDSKSSADAFWEKIASNKTFMRAMNNLKKKEGANGGEEDRKSDESAEGKVFSTPDPSVVHIGNLKFKPTEEARRIIDYFWKSKFEQDIDNPLSAGTYPHCRNIRNYQSMIMGLRIIGMNDEAYALERKVHNCTPEVKLDGLQIVYSEDYVYTLDIVLNALSVPNRFNIELSERLSIIEEKIREHVFVKDKSSLAYDGLHVSGLRPYQERSAISSCAVDMLRIALGKSPKYTQKVDSHERFKDRNLPVDLRKDTPAIDVTITGLNSWRSMVHMAQGNYNIGSTLFDSLMKWEGLCPLMMGYGYQEINDIRYSRKEYRESIFGNISIALALMMREAIRSGSGIEKVL